MKLEQFEQYVREAIAEVPVAVRGQMSNVAFVVENSVRAARQTERQIRSRGLLLGLYEGVPLPGRSAYYSGVLPDKITLFKRSIEQIAGSDPSSVRQLIREVVHHEIGHYLGMNEREVRAWERRRRR
ncbi:MAG: metallopeptidase family protein [Patescibacteria group bacterium]